MDREGIVRDAEVQLRRYDGTVIWARDTARAIRNADPHADPLVVYYEGAVEDITERKRAEEALEAARALQQSLIDEERQRIARELHDGLAQLLGYVSTKAMAVRLMLKNRQTEAAHQHLLQLEEAARELFVGLAACRSNSRLPQRSRAFR
jgi:signal transduction histidine kinase